MEWHELNEGRGDPRNQQPRELTRAERLAIGIMQWVAIIMVATLIYTGQ